MVSSSYYYAFDIIWKDVSCFEFYSERKKNVFLIDNILSETIGLFRFCALLSNIYPQPSKHFL